MWRTVAGGRLTSGLVTALVIADGRLSTGPPVKRGNWPAIQPREHLAPPLNASSRHILWSWRDPASTGHAADPTATPAHSLWRSCPARDPHKVDHEVSARLNRFETYWNLVITCSRQSRSPHRCHGLLQARLSAHRARTIRRRRGARRRLPGLVLGARHRTPRSGRCLKSQQLAGLNLWGGAERAMASDRGGCLKSQQLAGLGSDKAGIACSPPIGRHGLPVPVTWDVRQCGPHRWHSRRQVW